MPKKGENKLKEKKRKILRADTKRKIKGKINEEKNEIGSLERIKWIIVVKSIKEKEI